MTLGMGMAAVGIKLIAISIAINNREFKHDSLLSREYWFATYDYIVVGAGTAGCVVAARLADDITKTVLLLEAGGAQNSTSDVPALRPSLMGTDMDWNYELLPQKYAYFARSEGQVVFPSGRVFGGTSTISHLNYYRESPEYFQQWDKLYAIKNWTYEEVMPFFQKSENNLDSILVNIKETSHKSGGLITVSTANPDPILRRYLIATEKMGYNETLPDGRQPFGVTVMQRMISKEGAALSTSTAYLESKIRPNLHTFGNSLVTKILFDRTHRATEVRFQKEDSIWTVKARKEIIITAGVVGSAQLLLLSGVGPKEDMEEFDIPLVSDVAVGRNLKHSVFVELDYNIKNQSLIERPQMSTDTEFEYYNDRTGPLAYIASALHCFSERAEEGTGLTNGCVLPHIDFLDEKSDKLIAKVNLKTEWDEYYKQYLGHSVLKLKAILRRPKSTGSLYLASDNAMVRPVIDPKIFDIQSDIDDLVETLNQSLRIYNSEFMSEFVEPFESPVPGCRPCADDRFCEAYLRCLVYTITDYPYLVGTCRMGPKEDPNAVVDERFRVRGVTGLRVIDASVLPMATEQTVAIVVMLAERGVTFIEEDNKGSTKLPELKLNLTSFNNIFNTNWIPTIPTPKD